MSRVCLNKKIVAFVRKFRGLRSLGNGTMSGVVTEAMRYFLHKHDKCMECQFHKEQVANIELGRQRLALAPSQEDGEKNKGEWIACKADVVSGARGNAARSGRMIKQVFEQAIMEHVTRPSECATCPYYEEMSHVVRAGGRKAN